MRSISIKRQAGCHRIKIFIGVLLVLAGVSPVAAQISPGPLTRAHERLEGPGNCLKCHGAGVGAMDKSCLSCHEPIAGLEAMGTGLHARVAAQTCASCHPDHAGRDFPLIHWEEGSAEKFEHARSGWPLVGKHADLKCRNCHEPGHQSGKAVTSMSPERRKVTWLGLSADCRSCHEDVHQGSADVTCTNCHSQDAWKPASGFDHARSAYPLTGKHSAVSCVKCHPAAASPAPASRPPASAARVVVFKPVAHAECSDCHRDPHQARLGARCSSCHVTEDFHKVSKVDFDHSQTRFPLAGSHAKVDCAGCHDPKTAWGKKPAFDRCAACHEDSHAGEATLSGKKADCSACHGVVAFRPATFSVTQHDSSAYPLVGRHRSAPCASCHDTVSGSNPKVRGAKITRIRLKHDACVDCHDQAHGSQLVERPDHGACETCHSVAGWTPSLFTIEQHARLKLPLDGRHAAIGCAACHAVGRRGLPPAPPPATIGTAKVTFAHELTRCIDCHRDAHDSAAGDAGTKRYGQCLNCHTTAVFRPSTVDATAHRAYAFPLNGAHQAIQCESCHPGLAGRIGGASLVATSKAPEPLGFTARFSECRNCHETPHGRQFDGRRGGDDCSACHSAATFAPADLFDHDRDTSFKLKGAHQSVACRTCHPNRPDADGVIRAIYRSVDGRCENCHTERRIP